MTKSTFSTKIAIILEKGLLPWQELNVAAFLASAIAHKFSETMNPQFKDSDNNRYLAIFRQPVLIFEAKPAKLRRAYKRAKENQVSIGIYTRPILKTQGNENLKAVKRLREDQQDSIGIVLYGSVEKVDLCTRGISLHK